MAHMPKRRRRRRRLRVDSLNRLLPNALTMLGLCASLTAVRFGLNEAWHAGVILIAAAAMLDTLDGRMARLMGGPTAFGGQLDSLVDAISFGVAPVLLIYLWSLNSAGGTGWAIALLFVVCCVLRLARFNVASSDTDLPVWASGYFSGVPAPAGAGLVLLPMGLYLELEWEFLRSAWLTGPWVLAIAALLISRIPTYSFKRLRVPHRMVQVTMAGIAAIAVALIVEPWITLSVTVLAYAATIPFSIRSFRLRQAEEGETVKSTVDNPKSPGEPLE